MGAPPRSWPAGRAEGSGLPETSGKEADNDERIRVKEDIAGHMAGSRVARSTST
jgi:hypothetical protein